MGTPLQRMYGNGHKKIDSFNTSHIKILFTKYHTKTSRIGAIRMI